MKKISKSQKKQIQNDDIEILEDEECKKGSKDHYLLKNTFLIISIILLLGSVALFLYLFKNQKVLDTDVNKLQNDIINVKNKINENNEEKEQKENEYEKLKDELKEKVEELGIWEELEEKLKQALS